MATDENVTPLPKAKVGDIVIVKSKADPRIVFQAKIARAFYLHDEWNYDFGENVSAEHRYYFDSEIYYVFGQEYLVNTTKLWKEKVDFRLRDLEKRMLDLQYPCK